MKNILETHREMVLRLCKPGTDILKQLTPDDCHLLHMGGCLPGEASELYDVVHNYHDDQEKNPDMDITGHLLEELGDFLFYLVAVRDIFSVTANPQNFHLSGLSNFSSERLTVQLMLNSGHLWDVVKRITVYRKPWTAPDKKYQNQSLAQTGAALLSRIEADYNTLLRVLDIKPEAVAQANWEKLADADKGRYASGSYSDEQAQNRRDEQR